MPINSTGPAAAAAPRRARPGPRGRAPWQRTESATPRRRSTRRSNVRRRRKAAPAL